MALICHFSHPLGEIDACLLEVIGEFVKWWCLSDEGKLSLLERRPLLVVFLVIFFVFLLPVRLRAEEPVVLRHLEGVLMR